MRRFTDPSQVLADASLSPEARLVAADVIGTIVRAYTMEGAGYDPDSHGHLLLVQPGDDLADVEAELGHDLVSAPWEGSELRDGHWVTCLLWHDDGGVSVVFPDSWLTPAIRGVLRANLVDAGVDLG